MPQLDEQLYFQVFAKPASIGVKVLTVFPGNHGSAFDSHQVKPIDFVKVLELLTTMLSPPRAMS